MIDSLAGRMIERGDDFAVIDAGGIRFRAEVPASTLEQLPAAGQPAVVFTRLAFNANDGQFTLFGFATTVERECFDILNTISGIGPRKALGILSQIEVAAFAQAIVTNDLNYLSKLKGVGKKTAERLLVELREKMAPYAGTSSARPKVAAVPENVSDAIEALMALGCKPFVAEKAVRAAVEVLGEGAEREDLIREGLRHR